MVTVTVSGGEEEGNPLGVMIVSKLKGVSTMPADNGWTILSDTWGTDYNYNEVTSYNGQAEFVWTLESPSTAGLYTLYARMENSASGVAYYKDYSAGMAFTVQDGITAGSGSSFLSIQTPVEGTVLAGSVTIDATAVGLAGDLTSAALEIDGSIVDSTNGPPLEWSVDTTNMTDGEHTIKVTATSSEGETVSKEITVSVKNQGAMVAPVGQFQWNLADMAFLLVISFILLIGMMELRRRNRWQ